MNLKNLSWQQWTGIGIIAAVIIVIIILHFVQPKVSFAFAEIATIVGFLLGGFSAYLFNKKKSNENTIE